MRFLHRLFLPLTIVASATTAKAQRPLAIEDYYRLKTIGAAEISPDGRWVSFTVTGRIEETNGTSTERWRVPFDASSPAQLDSGGPRATTGGRGGRGGTPAALASPDGKFTATVRDIPPPARTKTYASDFEKRHDERFKGVQFDWMEFHRDGAAFPLPNVRDPYVSPPQEIFVGPTGGELRQLTQLGVRPVGVQWNHDGTALLFSTDSMYRDESVYGKTDVFAVSLDGKVRRLTPNAEYDYNGATYSPDGKWILASRQMSTDAIIAKKLHHGGAVDLVVIPSNGGAERVLTSAWDYIPAGQRWSPDGRSIYFTGGVGGTVHLFRVSPDGGPVQQVTSGQRRLAGFSFDSAFSHITYTVSTFDAPTELWGANIDGSGEHQLTHISDDFIKEVTLSHADRVQFKSKDGTPIEGWLTLPAGYSKDRHYPLVVSNHGGPHSAIEYGLNFKNQYLAANGYFVLEVNFRSSTNYGEGFLWATWGAWGTKDGQDVMAGIDYVSAYYPVDTKHVATIGHSYGGFMTNWLITQYPTRFAAAIPGAGIVNWTSDYANSDIPRTKETEFLGAPWDAKAREVMIKQSPLMYANRVKAPTLFINGEIDQRVPYSEAQQMYVALKKNGVPTKMIQYAGMPHAISGSWNIVHRMLNERAWLDRWLKDHLST